MKAVAVQLCLLVVIFSLLTTVNAHGYLSKPVSRNYYENLQSRFWNREYAASTAQEYFL
jgi:predicted carbohydrate-binding protein with CBM5 and CBM33 domain